MHVLAQMTGRRPVSIRVAKYRMPSANCLKQPARCKHHGRSPIRTRSRPHAAKAVFANRKLWDQEEKAICKL